MHHFPDTMWNEIIAEVDKNKNGTIDYEEFSDAMNRLLRVKYHSLSSLISVVSLRFKREFKLL